MATMPNDPPEAEREPLMRCPFCDFYCRRSEVEEMEKHEAAHFEGPEEETIQQAILVPLFFQMTLVFGFIKIYPD
jgi:hypothetical protein